MNKTAGEALVHNLKTSEFQKMVMEDSEPILLDFWARWCGPCLMMKPLLAEAAGMLAGNVRVAQVNVDEEPAIADAFGIKSIPTLVLMKGGKVVDAMTGVVPANQLVDRVKAKLGPTK